MGKALAIVLLMLLPVSAAIAAAKPQTKSNPKQVAQAFIKAAQSRNQAAMDKHLAKVNQGKPFPRKITSATFTGDAKITGREALVPVTMTFGNGDTVRTQIPLTQTADGWKVRLGMLARNIAPKKKKK